MTPREKALREAAAVADRATQHHDLCDHYCHDDCPTRIDVANAILALVDSEPESRGAVDPDMREAAVARYDSVQERLQDEPCAYKRACFRAGWDAASEALIDSETEPRGAVRVKALIWEAVKDEYVQTYQTKCAFGFYRVFEDEDSAAGAIWIEFAVNEDRFGMVDAVEIDRIYGEFDDAKAAAQADFEARILSALEPGDGWRPIETRPRRKMRPMADAPTDGTPILAKIKDDLSPWGISPGDFGNTAAFAGLHAVMRNRGDLMDWCFAAPVGRGGFSDAWLEGWWPLPAREGE